MSGLVGAPREAAHFMPRPRLSGLFEPTVPLTIVKGPSGSGKTSAVAEWARATGIPGVWVTMGEGLDGRIAFWHAVAAGASAAGLLTAEDRLPDASTDAMAWAGVVRRTLGYRQQPWLLVIDDAELLTDPELVADLVGLASGGQASVVLISAARTAFETEKTVLRLAPRRVDAAPFAFDDDELAALLGVPGGHPVIAAVQGATGGHPLLVSAVVASLGDRVDLADEEVSALVDAASERLLGASLFGGMSLLGDVRFAMRLSVADAVDEALAMALGEGADAAALLADYEAQGLGAWSGQGDAAEFRFAPGLLPMLRARARDELGDGLKQAHETAAAFAVRAGRPALALRHALAVDDLVLAERIVEPEWFDLVQRYPDEVVAGLASRPTRELAQHPVLLAMVALALYGRPATRPRALPYFRALVKARRLPATTAAERFTLAVFASGANRVLGEADASAQAADQALVEFGQLDARDRQRLGGQLTTLIVQLGISYLQLGRSDRAMRLFTAAYARPVPKTDPGWVHALALLAGASALDGDLGRARTLVQEAATAPGFPGWRDAYEGIFYRLAAAIIAVDDGELATARRHLDTQRIDVASLDVWAIHARVQALVDIAAGEPMHSIVALDEASHPGARPPLTSYASMMLEMSRITLLISVGRVAEARALLSEQDASRAEVIHAWARLHLAADEPLRALALLDGESRYAKRPRINMDGLALLEVAAQRSGSDELAREARLRLDALCEAYGVRNPIAVIPQPHTPAVRLTPREQIVLAGLARPVSRVDLARQLGVSPNTLKAQLRGLYRKLGAASRDDALRTAREQRLL